MAVTPALGALGIALYLAVTWRLASRLSSPEDRASRLPLPALLTILGGLLAHAGVLYQSVISEAGVNLALLNAASLIAWVVAALVLLATLSRPAESLGLFVLPFAALSIALLLLFPQQRLLSAEMGSGVQIHVLVSVLAYGLLTLAALQAVLVWLQDRALRAKHYGTLQRALPPLTTQEALLFQLIAAGFFFLSLSLVTGVMFVDDLLGQHLVHKTVLAVAAWLVFGTLLWGRWRHGWRGRNVVRWCLIGFASLVLAYFGAKLVLEMVLDRAWSA